MLVEGEVEMERTRMKVSVAAVPYNRQSERYDRRCAARPRHESYDESMRDASWCPEMKQECSARGAFGMARARAASVIDRRHTY